MNIFLETLNNLKDKYSNPSDPLNFVSEFNERINKFHRNEENINSFNQWIDKLNSKLNLNLETACSTFFPSFTFFIYYDILEFNDFKVYKMGYFHISFIEDYYTTQFVSYIREQKDGEVVIYNTNKRSKRDKIYDSVYFSIMEELSRQYPNKKFLDIEFTDFIIGNYQMTYSTKPKTSIFELLFRTKSY